MQVKPLHIFGCLFVVSVIYLRGLYWLAFSVPRPHTTSTTPSTRPSAPTSTPTSAPTPSLPVPETTTTGTEFTIPSSISNLPPINASNFNVGLVVLAHNRADCLTKVLQSVFALQNIHEVSIYVSLDDSRSIAALEQVIQSTRGAVPVEIWHMPPLANIPSVLASFQRSSTFKIAQHIKYALSQGFSHAAEHSHMILLEDDLVVAPDFLTFFQAAAPVLTSDPSLWCVSAWNDNGVRTVATDEGRLFRTDLFPGLGWMISREVWAELSPQWPVAATTGWDYWMRLDRVSRRRECIVPEVSRTQHVAERGSTVRGKEVKRYKELGLASRPASTGFGDLSYLLRDTYELLIRDLVNRSCTTGNPELRLFTIEDWATIATGMKFWTEFPRATHNGLVITRSKSGGLLLLADRRTCPYLVPGPFLTQPRILPKLEAVAITALQGESCTAACRRAKVGECIGSELFWLNSCEAMGKLFPCEAGCGHQAGDELPAYVVDDAQPTNQQCLVTSHPAMKCDSSHRSTRRICPCIAA